MAAAPRPYRPAPLATTIRGLMSAAAPIVSIQGKTQSGDWYGEAAATATSSLQTLSAAQGSV